jgi:hypothetical protein
MGEEGQPAEAAKERPSVLVVIGGDEAAVYCDIKQVNAVVLDTDEMKNVSRGYLCEAYKEAWTLHPKVRSVALKALIVEVKRQCPIMATLVLEAWVNDHAVEIDEGRVKFDVTEALLNRGPDYMENLRDDDYPTDDLADDVSERKEHKGPFRVEIKEAAMEFLYADENEREEAKRKEELRKERGYATEEEKAAMKKQGCVFTEDFDHLPPKVRNQALRAAGIDPATAPSAEEREKQRARSERGRKAALKAWETRRKKKKAEQEGEHEQQA